MREKVTTFGRRPRDVVPLMNSFVSVFHASNLDAQKGQSQSQAVATNSYCYIPGQYWQMLDYYDMAMDICTDYTDVRSIGVVATHPGMSLIELPAHCDTSAIDDRQHLSQHRRRLDAARVST